MSEYSELDGLYELSRGRRWGIHRIDAPTELRTLCDDSKLVLDDDESLGGVRFVLTIDRGSNSFPDCVILARPISKPLDIPSASARLMIEQVALDERDSNDKKLENLANELRSRNS